MIKENEQKAKDTGLAIILILLLTTYLTDNLVYVLPTIAILILTMTWPVAFTPLSYLWFGFSKILGEVVSRIILSIVFVLVAVPIGVIRKFLGADSMKIKEWKQSEDSVFNERKHTYSNLDLERPY
ncbi:MAG: hypothetical protein GY705_19230 [Bacteroidetes bacterium]|nr:hypothetical protein [Bacteroidota bacterium]